MTGGSGVDDVNLGLGADFYTTGGGNDVIHLAAATDTGLAIGFIAGVAPVNGTAINVSGLDVITGYGAGVMIDLGIAGLSTTFIRNGGTFTTNSQGLITGTYDSATATFTIGTSGTSTLYVFDDDGSASVTTNYRGIVLVGYVDAAGNDTAAATGLTAVA